MGDSLSQKIKPIYDPSDRQDFWFRHQKTLCYGFCFLFYLAKPNMLIILQFCGLYSGERFYSCKSGSTKHLVRQHIKNCTSNSPLTR